MAAGKVDEARVAAERRRIEREEVNRAVLASPAPTGAARDAEYDLVMRLGEAVNAAHHLAAVAPEEARIVGLDDVVDRWERELAVFYWRTVARGDARKQDGVLDLDQGTDRDIHRTVPTEAKIDYERADNFNRDSQTIYLIALPLHLNPDYEVQVQPELGYFLDPYEAASEARRRLEFQVENAPVEHRHNFAVSGAAVIPVHPHGVEPRFDLKPWPVRLVRNRRP
ncbi:hypothetical protein [Tsukamurella paurometabola]|uniref:hypothetical protein n=1 Tax=Tsukamurella paurometabola TaxID=2061 RepID=UPI0013DFAC15|nr:hypothetical protein [Tsukamurella paurometabola]UEA83297.1 hypothetical protein LK411_00090 [Tsukamurella paurometabola]